MSLDRKTILASVAIVVGSVAVLLLSPLLLLAVQRLYSVDWQTLSDIGQSYTGIATILSFLTIAGAIYSIAIQTRQSAAQQQQAARQMQFTLMQMTMDRKNLARLYTETGELSEAKHERFTENIFMTFMFRFIEFEFLAGNLSEQGLRHALRTEIFDSPRFRTRWEEVEPYWRGNRLAPKEKRFADIAHDECAKSSQ